MLSLQPTKSECMAVGMTDESVVQDQPSAPRNPRRRLRRRPGVAPPLGVAEPNSRAETQADGPRHHVIISGTGRAGTTFLVGLLTRLGVPTGYSTARLKLDPRIRAGLEWDIRSPNAPYLVKSPGLCNVLPPLLDSGKVIIDRAIVPVRDFDAAAASRKKVESTSVNGEKMRGGLWLTRDPDQQVAVLREQFCSLMASLVKHDVPITLLAFPRLLQDEEYLFRKLRGVIPNDYARFRRVFRQSVRKDWVSAA